MARVAKSLETLRLQLNGLFPNRSKVSDGGIGDTRHSKLKSDHNPNSSGVVTARDFTFDTDPSDGIGIDCRQLAKVLFEKKDPRIKYIIFERKITLPGLTGWKFYTGTNPHNHHLHLSVSSDPKLYDDASPWDLDSLIPNAPQPSADIPAKQAEQSASYTVKANDTAGKISKETGVKLEDLTRLNNLDGNYMIKVGQKLRLK